MSTICKPSDTQLILSNDVFQQHLAQFDDLPWLQDLKKQNWDKYNEIDLPGRYDEEWRFTTLSRIKLDDYRLIEGEEEDCNDATIEASSIIPEVAGSLILKNNHRLQENISDELKSNGVIFEPLSSAFRNHPDLIKKYYFSETGTIGSDKFKALHAAYCSNGTFLYIPKGTKVSLPLITYNWTYGDLGSIFPHTLIIAEDNSSASFIDYYGSMNESTSIACGLSTMHMGQGAQVHRTSIQNLNDQSQAYQIENIISAHDSKATTVGINLGCNYARLETKLDIRGAGSEADIFALTISTDKQEFDQRTLQIHGAPNAASNILYKNALLDKSRTIFSGMIRVDECAQQTDAYQKNKNLLLSNTATANSLPGLEIMANDVKCSHGATSSRLNEEEMFYMKSRGIPEKTAQKLLVFGFFEEILSELKNENLAEYIRDAAHKKFDTAEADS